MEDLQSNTPDSQPGPTNVQEEAHYEDEISLIDYFRVIFSPGNYKVTYVYDVSNWNLNENNYKILLDRFYSAENTGKMATKLQENGLYKHANCINTGMLKKFVDFEISPSYVNHSKFKTINSVELQQLRQLEAQLLNMTIIGRPENNISKISSVIRDNFENIMPVYTVKDQLNAAARRLRAKIAALEENRANLELDLKTNKRVLAKLKNIKTKASDKRESNVALQFDISGKTEYLPIEYQIQAAESKTIQIEEQTAANEEKYNYYKDLLALNEKLFAELNGKVSSYYTIGQFRLFLIDLIDSYQNKQLKNYLNSYIKKIENRISAGAPVVEKPKVYAVCRGTVKKSAITFVVLLMVTTFVAFLLEGIGKSRLEAS